MSNFIEEVAILKALTLSRSELREWVGEQDLLNSELMTLRSACRGLERAITEELDSRRDSGPSEG